MTPLVSNKVHLFTGHRNIPTVQPWGFHFLTKRTCCFLDNAKKFQNLTSQKSTYYFYSFLFKNINLGDNFLQKIFLFELQIWNHFGIILGKPYGKVIHNYLSFVGYPLSSHLVRKVAPPSFLHFVGGRKSNSASSTGPPLTPEN